MQVFSTKKREGKNFLSLFKYCFCIAMLVALCLNANAQYNNDLEKPFKFGFNIASTLIPKPHITKEFGTAELLTRNTFGFEIGVTLIYKVNKIYNFISGLYFGKLPYSWGFDLPVGKYSSLKGYGFSEKGSVYDINYWYLPLNFETQFYNKERININLAFGVNIRHYLDGQTAIGYEYGYTDSLKKNDEFFLLVLDVNYPYKVRINYQLGINTYLKLKNSNNIKVGLNYNFSFAKIVQGYYGFFQNTSEYSLGKYSMTGSYLALSLGYVFTGESKLKQKRKDY